MSLNPTIGPGGAEGAYSVSDQGCSGDRYAVSPKSYPVPGYLRTYDDLRKALRVSVDTCELQQGVCWVLRAGQLHQRCGQACAGGCPTPGPLNGFPNYPDPVRRSVEQSWVPVAKVSAEGVSLVPQRGCVLPIWQRIFYVGNEQNAFQRDQAGAIYRAAVEAARYLARTQRRPRVVFGKSGNKVVPVVYVEPGGIVRAVPRDRGWETRADLMSDFEVRQYEALSRGASLMPFGM